MEKVAIIELNEKELKLSIFNVVGARKELALEQSQSLSIGKEIEREELLSPQTKNKILEILKVYRKMIENFHVDHTISVAMSIVASARNYRGFMDEIYNNTGLSFNIMGDEDQIKYLFSAIINSIDNPKGIFVYIGGFSSYIVKYNRRAIATSVILPFGTNNINEKDEVDLNSIVKSFKKKIDVKDFVHDEEEDIKIIGVGNTFLSMGKIAKKITRYPLDIDNNYVISLETINKTYEFIKGIELDKIRKIKGVNYDDADKIAIGFAMIKAISEILPMKEVIISNANIRAGVLSVNVLSSVQERFNDLLSNSLDNYLTFNKNEFSINENVHNLSIILFKQLKVMHKLPRFYVKPLRIASYMYDCGKSINVEDYAKHGLEKILYSGINGATHRELLIAGFICVCQNLDEFSLNEWIKYKDILTDEDLDAVRKLGVILKLAVNLNASRRVVIQDVVCDILGDSIIMKTVVEGDATYEIMEGMKVAPEYKKVYKKCLQII